MDRNTGVEVKTSFLKIDNSGKLLIRESSNLEFKENFNFGNFAEYARIMASFANNDGGWIVFGIKDSPRVPVGIDSNRFNEIPQEKITSFLLDHFSAEIKWEIGLVKKFSKFFGFIFVSPCGVKPVICKRDHGKDLKNGEIYYRYRAQSRNIEFTELQRIVDEIKNKEKRSWLNFIRRVAKIGPENTALLNLNQGKFQEQNSTLVIDKRLVPQLSFIKESDYKKKDGKLFKLVGKVYPATVIAKKQYVSVKSTSDPNAPVMRLTDDEIKKAYPWDYKTLTKQLRKRYKDFCVDRKYHRLRKQCVENRNFAHRRYLNPENPKSSHQDFYNSEIIEIFDKNYSKK